MARQTRLPTSDALAFFEHAARLLSFSAAARALGTTQPAVSHRIGQIERELGVALFMRQARGVALTEPGIKLYEAVRESRTILERAIAEIRASQRPTAFTVACDYCFAAYWFMPRMPELMRAVPGLDLRLLTSEEDFAVLSPQVDFAIAFGDGHWEGCQAEALFPELVVPVCSPGYRDTLGPWHDSQALSSATLLHLDSPGPARWLGWNEWFAAQQLPPPPPGGDHVFDNSSLVLQAAASGQGVALGWRPLIEDQLARGELVLALDAQVTTPRGYYLVEPLPCRRSTRHHGFRQWMLQAAQDACIHLMPHPSTPKETPHDPD